MKTSNIKVYSDRDFPAYLPKLNSLYDDLFEGGKGFRSFLTQKVAGPLDIPQSTIQLLCQTIEFIHNASLLHDDLIDRSQLRRGKTAAWLKYTPEYAVLAGDYLLARVMVNLSSYGNIELVRITSQTISELLEGEWIQDSLVGDFELTLDRLNEVHNLKTASLFRWCLYSPFVVCENRDEDLKNIVLEMGSILGLLFQRSDDLLDFDIRNIEGKIVLGDLKSGYLNSFAAFMTEGFSLEKRESLRGVNELEDLYQIIDKEFFLAKVKEFDQMNKDLIDVYNHHLKALSGKLEESQRGLIANITGLAELLYWRKKPDRGAAH